MPSITAVSVGGAIGDDPTETSGSHEGVTLDIAVAGSVAPGAKLIVYFGQNTEAGFLNALTTAIHDTTDNPSIICISWDPGHDCKTVQNCGPEQPYFKERPG